MSYAPGSLSVERRGYVEPRLESLDDISNYTNPGGQIVLSVAAYGGYPIGFLVEGAERVVSFDLNSNQVAWNAFLRTTIQISDDREQARKFIAPTDDEYESDGYHEFVDQVITKLGKQELVRSMYGLAMRTFRGEHSQYKIGLLYPHLKDDASFELVKQKVEAGAWEIHKDELLSVLDMLLLERVNQGAFGIVYLSSIRNWMKSLDYNGDETKFDNEYDKPLAAKLGRLLASGGVIYEALIGRGWIWPGFSADPMDQKIFEGFEITEHDSQVFADHGVVIARKK